MYKVRSNTGVPKAQGLHVGDRCKSVLLWAPKSKRVRTSSLSKQSIQILANSATLNIDFYAQHSGPCNLLQLYLHPAQKRIMSVFFDKDFEYQPYRLHLAADCKIDMCVRFSKTAIHGHRSACIHVDHAHVRTEE